VRKRYQISYQLKILLNIAIYVIFFSYMVSLVLAAQSVSAKSPIVRDVVFRQCRGLV
jgi:hypothetical protein